MSQAVMLTKEKVQRYLTDWLGTVELDREGDFTIQLGSARVFITTSPFAEEESVVEVIAPMNMDVPRSTELFEYVATNRYVFGHLEVLEHEGALQVHFRHTLLGEFLDPDELKRAVGAVAHAADELDDEVKQKFGGRRFHEE